MNINLQEKTLEKQKMVDKCLSKNKCKCEFDLDMAEQETCVMCGARHGSTSIVPSKVSSMANIKEAPEWCDDCFVVDSKCTVCGLTSGRE